MPFLLKTEPTKYSFDDLVRDGETVWDGISNNQALLLLRSMKPGEKLVIYHSQVGKSAVGLAKVVSVDSSDPKNPLVRIAAGKRLKHEKTLAELRTAAVFKDSLLFRQSASPSSRSLTPSTTSSLPKSLGMPGGQSSTDRFLSTARCYPYSRAK